MVIFFKPFPFAVEPPERTITLKHNSTGANIITLIIFVIVAVAVISGVIAVPAPNTCATS